jgi:hypothetical protein
MTGEQLERLRASDGKNLQITCSDGEIIQAKILFIDDEYRDVVCDLLSTTKPERYEQERGVCIAINWDDITGIQEIAV